MVIPAHTRWAALTTSVILLASGLVLWPYINNGLWADDAYNSQIWGMVHRFDTTLWAFTARITHNWVTQAGRLLVAWPWIYSFFYVVHDMLAVRLVNLAFVALHIGCFVYLMRLLRVSWTACALFALILPMLFQMRGANDPVAAFATFSQVLGILLTGGLIFIAKWYASGKTLHLVAATLIVGISLLGYEINLVFFPLAVIAILAAPHPHKLRNLLVLMAPCIAFLAATAYVKSHTTTPYPGTAIGQLSAVPLTYAVQAVAALPGSYYGLFAIKGLPPEALWATTRVTPLAWAAALAVLVAMLAIGRGARRHERGRPDAWAAPALVATVLALGPPALIALSARYQAELDWGLAHLPVYYQQFGVALMLALVMRAGVRPTWGACALGTLVAAYAAFNLTVNLRTAEPIDAWYKEPLMSFSQALDDGLLAEVAEGDVLEPDKGMPPYINGNLIYQRLHKRVSVSDEVAIAGLFEAPPRPGARHFRLWRDPARQHAWRVDALSAPAPLP
ncbi:MAG: hypothetical protein QM639_18065 [Rhodocyclaceae bacterium]